MADSISPEVQAKIEKRLRQHVGSVRAKIETVTEHVEALIDPINQLRALRLRKGWTMKECAVKLGATYGALKSWECGERQPTSIVQNAIREFVRRHK